LICPKTDREFCEAKLQGIPRSGIPLIFIFTGLICPKKAAISRRQAAAKLQAGCPFPAGHACFPSLAGPLCVVRRPDGLRLFFETAPVGAFRSFGTAEAPEIF
jgi:hypothetical protein